MDSHTHPGYEETFNRIATILDVIAESQAEHVQAMAEIREIQIEQAKALEETRKAQKEQAESHARLSKTMERLALKSSENEDKLNALITLMAQHIDEHHRKD